MSWPTDFYSRTGHWWGPAESRITDRDTRRVDLLHALRGKGPYRVLELGAGYGSTAVATADAGHDVTAVELTDRINYLPRRPGTTGALRVVQADFYDVDLTGQFDIITYWNGFGVGTDDDQRRLLRRVSAEWLSDNGTALIDVSNPFGWARWHGDEEHRLPNVELGYVHELHERTEFDPLSCTASDTWWEAGRPDDPVTQWLRCYTPADLQLLLDGTRLRLDHLALIGGAATVFDDDRIRSLLGGPEAVHEYTAVLGLS